jgi:hypothetical protein
LFLFFPGVILAMSFPSRNNYFERPAISSAYRRPYCYSGALADRGTIQGALF